jgi:hypothetical protein
VPTCGERPTSSARSTATTCSRRGRRSGDTVTGSCSADGTTWAAAGSFAVPAGDALDAGLFMTAANGWTGARGAVEFDGFLVS